MTPEELQAAEARLAERPEYDWLVGDARKAWYQVAEVARGAGVSRDTVRNWCERGLIPGAVNYDVGWRMPRSGLVEFFARQQRGGTASAG